MGRHSFSNMEEYLDICDEKGNLTGEVKLRSQVHADGDWHRAAHMWVLNGRGDILIQRRSTIKVNSPDMFDISAGGHVTSGSSVMETALSELEEEIGVRATEEELVHIGEVTKESVTKGGTYINKEFNDIFVLVRDKPAEDFILQEEEVAYVKWISIEEFRRWVAEEKEDLVMHREEFEILFNYLNSH